MEVRNYFERGLKSLFAKTTSKGRSRPGIVQHLEIRQMLSSAPVDVTATAVPTGIQLNWGAVAGTNYNVYRGNYPTGESVGGTSTALSTHVTTNSFLDPNADLVSGKDYYYVVTSVAGGVESSSSNEAYAFANGPFIDPTVDFSTGFPVTSARQFISTGNVFNSDSTISVGGTLAYITPVNANQFNFQFEFQQASSGGALDLSMHLREANGDDFDLFDGVQAAESLATFDPVTAGKTYLIQGAYDQDTPDNPGFVYGYCIDTSDGAGTSFGPVTNIAADFLGGNTTAQMTLVANNPGSSATLENLYYANSFVLPPSAPIATASASGINLQFSNNYLGYDSESNFGGPVELRIYRGTSPGEEGLTPIATIPFQGTGESYLDTTAVPGTTYYYVADGGSGAATSEVSATIPAVRQPMVLTGTPIGTSATWDGTGTIAQVFDGNLNTFFDPANGDLTNWVGLDLGKQTNITQISYAPRPGYEFRMLDGQFQVSNTADFSSGVQTIYTINATPTADQLTTINVNPGAGYRYIRYTGGLQWVNIAEMKVFGYQAPPPFAMVSYAGNPIGTLGGWTTSSTVAAASDGNLSSYFDPASGNLSDWAGLDLVAPVAITQISFAPRAGYAYRMVGGQFQVSSTPDFSSNVLTLYTITATPVGGQLTTVTVPAVGAFRYVRYTGGTQWVNIAEMEFAGPAGPVPLTGTAIGTPGGWTTSSTITAAFDGNVNTFFDPATGNLADWVGLNLGSAQTITQIKYVARAGYEFRMVGAEIQVSSTPDFSANVQTIYTITSAPLTGQVVTINIAPVTAQYIRYIGGTQWVNIADLEVDGL